MAPTMLKTAEVRLIEAQVTELTHLRPVERRILAMRAEGQSIEDIAGRLHKSPRHVERMIAWTDVPRTSRSPRFARAMETRVLAMREQGQDHDEIGRRFRRSADNIRQIEALAYYRRALALLRGTT